MSWLVAIVLASLAAAAPIWVSEAAHSPSVAAVAHAPSAPLRGEPVELYVRLADDTAVDRIRAIYCRVQSYACGEALLMDATGGGEYTATIPWTSRFFDRVTRVGYQFEIRHANGTQEVSPTANHPDTPSDLPKGAGLYYFYALPKEAPTGGAAIVVGVLALLAAAAAGRDHR